MRNLINLFVVFSLFVAMSSIFSQEKTEVYNGKLELEGKKLTSEEKYFDIVFTGKIVNIRFDVDLTEAMSDHYNHINLKGTADGTLTNNSFTASGSVAVITSEKGKQTDNYNSSITFKGEVIELKGEKTVKGKITMDKEGDIINGSFTGKNEATGKISVLFIKGDAQIYRRSTGKTEKLTDKTSINLEDEIITGPDTRVELQYPDGTAFRIKSNTVVKTLFGGLFLDVGGMYYNIQHGYKEFFWKPNVIYTTTGNIRYGGKYAMTDQDMPGNDAGLLIQNCYADDNEQGIISVEKEGIATIKVISGSLMVTNEVNKDSIELTRNKSLTLKLNGEVIKGDIDGDKEIAAFESDSVESKTRNSSGEKVSTGKNYLILILGIVFIVIVITALVVILIIVLKKRKTKIK
jgi:hypothetical protein